MKFVHIENYSTQLSKAFVNLFMILLLPPIIFESGYNMQKKAFFKNIGAIFMYSFIGTFIAIISSSVMFYFCGLADMTPFFSVSESFAFGSLISSTDPVAVLAIFKELNADLTLYSIIFGEAIFNDAIAITMYKAVLKASSSSTDYGLQILLSFKEFIVIFVGSMLIGGVMALMVSFVIKRLNSRVRE